MAEMFQTFSKRSSPAATTNGDGVSALQFVRKLKIYDELRCLWKLFKRETA